MNVYTRKINLICLYIIKIPYIYSMIYQLPYYC